ncbi:MAG TPA: phage holin family protein [Thermoleophilaceae bacterium]|nr:phage holin family protein [Thermoleophilaceae bacterium]
MPAENSGGDPRDRPVAELLKELSNQTTTLVKQELELAKAEMAEKGKKAGLGAGMFGGAGLFGLLALGSLTASLIAALDTGMELWLAALIVTVVHAVIAGALALVGKQKTQEATPPAPQQAIDSTKEDVQWAKNQAKSAKR